MIALAVYLNNKLLNLLQVVSAHLELGNVERAQDALQAAASIAGYIGTILTKERDKAA
jgi:endonuclease/exonuclease/phosphatase family metal-dependent hydrolase